MLPGDDDAVLALQLAMQTVYEVYGYEASLNYALPPAIPLSDEQSTWVEQRLREAGMR